MDYLSMVVLFYFNNQEKLIHIHNRMENCMEVCLMENHQKEEDNLIKNFLENHTKRKKVNM
jgi:hypothetical protein